MRVRLRVYGLLHSMVGNVPDTIDMPGRTLGDLVDFLGQQYGPQVKAELLDEEGNLDMSYAFFVRGEKRSRRDAELREGDEVVITNILGGG